ncbi:hypothetical protein BJ944DRAFT_251521 [Cunninghamella echinulata]|nr:hypothetical protein BJ944DRAFT_251521 [Cunninghamella echinulata]
MNPQREQLTQFEHQVIEDHPNQAGLFATNGFLNALTSLYNEEAEDITLLKDIIRAFTIILPPVFLTICKNETETDMWTSTEFFLNELETTWLQHENTGVRIYAYKCLGQLLLITSKKERSNKNNDDDSDKYTDIFSLNMIRPGHGLLNLATFEKKNQQWLDLLLDKLSDPQETTTSAIMAIINCLPPFVKLRPQFTRIVIGTLVSWCKKKPTYLKEIELRHIEKSIKLAFISMVKNERLSAYRSELIGAFGTIGGNVAIFQNRRSGGEDSSRRKRTHHPESTSATATPINSNERADKRLRTEKPTSSSPSNSQHTSSNTSNIDVTLLPLNVVVDLCVAILQNVTSETIEQRINMVPPSMLKEEPERSTTPPYPPPESPPPESSLTTIQQQQEVEVEVQKDNHISKEESVKMETDDDTATNVHTPLASIEERASQSLRIQPYNLADPLPLSNDERKELIKMSIQRLLDMNEPAQITPSTMKNEQQRSVSHIPFHTSSSLAMKHFWIGLLSKLMTRGLSIGILKNLLPPYPPSSSLSPSPSPSPSSIGDDIKEEEHEEKNIANDEVMEEEIKKIEGEDEIMTDIQEDKISMLNNIAVNDYKESIADSKEVKILASMEQQISDQWKNVLIDFIANDFPNRYELAIAWLHEERYYDMQYSKSTLPSPTNEKRQHTYFDWLHKLIDRSITQLDPKDKTLNKLLLALPTLNSTIINKLDDIMTHEPHRFVMCVATLRDLTMQRPTVRKQCLDILLELCLHDDIKRRSTAIAAVKRWVPTHPTLSEKVETHGIEMLQMVLVPTTTKKPKNITTNTEQQQKQGEEDKDDEKDENEELEGKKDDKQNVSNEEKEMKQENDQEKEEEKKEEKNSDDADENEDDEIVEWNEKDVIRYMDLFLALCTKKYELLEQLFSVYIQAEKQVQGWIRTHIYKVISTMNSESEVLMNLIKNYPKGCETLILRILNILCSNPTISTELRGTVRYIYFDKGLRAKFLLPIINNQ